MPLTPRWPRNMVIEELFVNDNGQRNHVHVASKERRKLIKIAKIAQKHYAGTDPAAVREFPPFETVENVHSSSSWHYRDSSNPNVARDFYHRGNGLAFDLRSINRESFAREVKRRYGAKECDF